MRVDVEGHLALLCPDPPAHRDDVKPSRNQLTDVSMPERMERHFRQFQRATLFAQFDERRSGGQMLPSGAREC